MGGKSSKGLSAEWDELKLISIKESFKARIHWLQISNASRSPINFDLSTTDLDYEEMGRIADFMKNNEIFFKTTVTIALVGVQLDQETACKILDAAPKGLWKVTVNSSISPEIAAAMVVRLPGQHCKLELSGPLSWMPYGRICHILYPSRKFHGTTVSFSNQGGRTVGHAGSEIYFSVNRPSERWFPVHLFIMQLLKNKYKTPSAYWMLPFDVMRILLEFTSYDSESILLNDVSKEAFVPEVEQISEGFMIHQHSSNNYLAIMECSERLSETISEAEFMSQHHGVSVSFDSSLFSGKVTSWEGDNGEVNMRKICKSHSSQPTPAVGSTVQYYIQPYGNGLLATGKILVAKSPLESKLSDFVVGTRCSLRQKSISCTHDVLPCD